jgi:hypothetical protein
MARAVQQGAPPRVDLLGELEVETALVSRGWHPIRLDTRRMAANADLLAVNRRQRVSVQVKTMTGGPGPRRHIFLGYAGSYLSSGTRFFNAKKSPLIADVVVGVNYRPNDSRLVVLPVALAEKLCREAAKYWYKVRKKDGAKRSAAFPINLNLSGKHKVHADHREAVQQVVSKYEDAWDVLSEPIENLHDPKRWPLK